MYQLGMTILESDRFITREESTWTPPQEGAPAPAAPVSGSDLPIVPLLIFAGVVLLLGRRDNKR